MRPHHLVTLVTITPAHPAEVLTFPIENVNVQLKKKNLCSHVDHFIATVYRPTGPYTAFLTEFPEFLSDLVMADNNHIFGDFNIHMEKST